MNKNEINTLLNQMNENFLSEYEENKHQATLKMWGDVFNKLNVEINDIKSLFKPQTKLPFIKVNEKYTGNLVNIQILTIEDFYIECFIKMYGETEFGKNIQHIYSIYKENNICSKITKCFLNYTIGKVIKINPDVGFSVISYAHKILEEIYNSYNEYIVYADTDMLFFKSNFEIGNLVDSYSFEFSVSDKYDVMMLEKKKYILFNDEKIYKIKGIKRLL